MSLKFWSSPSDRRFYPGSPAEKNSIESIYIAKNERCSFQVLLRDEVVKWQHFELKAEFVGRHSIKSKGTVRLRRVGYVPQAHANEGFVSDELNLDGINHIPGFAPDPLLEEAKIRLPQSETHAFWVSVNPGKDCPAGKTIVRVSLKSEWGEKRSVDVSINLANISLEKRENFPVTQWFYIDEIMSWYKTNLHEDRFWKISAKYIKNAVEHGQDTLLIPFLTPPLDGEKRPTQLIHILKKGTKYTFDLTLLDKYIKMARRQGIRQLEMSHLFTQWGAANALRVYEGNGESEKLLWPEETSATSQIYRNFLSQLLPVLHKYLSKKRLLDKTFFHLSDEPIKEHIPAYRKAREMLREIAPWIKVMDAMRDPEFHTLGLTDMPIPIISQYAKFKSQDIPTWCYYCCAPRGKSLNRFLDTPLPKIAMHGLLFYKLGPLGFLHWGLNFWGKRAKPREQVNPLLFSDGEAWPGWSYGDPFMLYPGDEGPMDSIRWEIFGESLQDYALLQTLGVKASHPMLKSLKSFDDFPKDRKWRAKLRKKLLSPYLS